MLSVLSVLSVARRGSVGACLAFACLLASASPLSQPDTPLLRYVDTTGSYARWWEQTEACAGRRAEWPLRAAQFFVLTTTREVGLGRSAAGYVIAGYAYTAPYAIVLGSPWLRDSAVVRHEMLHLIVGAGHDPEFFQRRCKAAVMCVGSCLSDTLGAAQDLHS